MELRTVHDQFVGKDASGPHLPNGNPEFGWRQFQAPPIQHEAAARIEELEDATCRSLCATIAGRCCLQSLTRSGRLRQSACLTSDRGVAKMCLASVPNHPIPLGMVVNCH